MIQVRRKGLTGIAKKRQMRKQRAMLFFLQDGKCHWCKCDMILTFAAQPDKQPGNLATIDHLDSKWSKDRGKHAGEYRRVLACWHCNQERNDVEMAMQSDEVLWGKSGRAPLRIDPKIPLEEFLD